MFGLSGKCISSHGSRSQVSGLHVVKSFTSRTPGAAATASVSGAAAPPRLGMPDGVPTARGVVAVVLLSPRVRSLLGEAAPRIEPPSWDLLSASASSPAVARKGGHHPAALAPTIRHRNPTTIESLGAGASLSFAMPPAIAVNTLASVTRDGVQGTASCDA
jgi:hypothetical protein